jgi:hypothetical protein
MWNSTLEPGKTLYRDYHGNLGTTAERTEGEQDRLMVQL